MRFPRAVLSTVLGTAVTAAATTTLVVAPAQPSLAVPAAARAASSAPAARAGGLPSEAQWRADVAAAEKGSQAHLSDAVAAHPGEKLAINLDIDNTSLATEYRPGSAVGPTLQLARKADRLGVAVFFNTGRNRAKAAQAARQLAAAGFPVDGMCYRNDGESLTHSKQRCRDLRVAQGYRYVASVGNNPTDLSGTHTGKRYRLPNYGGRLS